MSLPGYDLAYSGKVRDLYVPEGMSLESAPELLMVASDRVSAFDHVLSPGIPGKGAVLTAMTLWWFAQLGLPNQLAGDHADGGDAAARIPEEVRERALLVRALDMLPIECVVRGRLTGSGLKEYREAGTVTGIVLPAGLDDGDALPEPIFTPAWKAPLGEHDENIPFERVIELVGETDAQALRAMSVDVFARAVPIAAARGLVLADTKLEFGRDRSTGELVLADEVLTSDSSRYWDADALASGRVESFDKQIVRDWLAAHWNGKGTPPELPHDVVQQTASRYLQLAEHLTA